MLNKLDHYFDSTTFDINLVSRRSDYNNQKNQPLALAPEQEGSNVSSVRQNPFSSVVQLRMLNPRPMTEWLPMRLHTATVIPADRLTYTPSAILRK